MRLRVDDDSIHGPLAAESSELDPDRSAAALARVLTAWQANELSTITQNLFEKIN